MAQILHHTTRTRPIDLSGVLVHESLYTAENETNVRNVKLVYDEATSSHAGVQVRVGKIGSASFFSTFTTEASKAAGNFVNLERSNSVLLGGETLTVECDGGKTGTGIVSVQVELNHDLIL